MKVLISKSDIKGKVKAPSSKSYTIRGLVCAALARGESEIVSPLDSDDTEASLDVLSKLGIQVYKSIDSWKVNGGIFREPATDLFCRESAATLRFMTAICSLVCSTCRLTSAPSLAARPIRPLLQALRQLGIECFYQENEAVVVVKGGKLKSGVAELPGNISSQFVSALLFVSPFTSDRIKIRLTTPLESQPFVLMTIDCLRKFGIRVNYSPNLSEFETFKQRYQPARYEVEGDWSSASYLLALGALCGGVEVENLNQNSLQGDRVILDFLKDMGALVVTGNSSITVGKSDLRAIKADLTDCIDLLPTLAALAASAQGVSEFTGIERARIKESNRVEAVRDGLEKMGVKVSEDEDKLIITGSPVKGAVIDTRGDHRIAMAFSLLGLSCSNVIIEGAECVSKTYPEFWDKLISIGGQVKLDG